MASTIVAGLKIAASATGLGVFGGAKKSLLGLKTVTEQLRTKQDALGDSIKRNMGTLAPSTLSALNTEYLRLGQTIDRVRLKQERLQFRLARREQLSANRAELRGQAKETAATAAVAAAPLILALRKGINFQDQLRDLRITAEFDAAQEAELGMMIRNTSINANQQQSDVGIGVGVLVAGGLNDLKALKEYTPIMAEVATATSASMEDLGKTTIALRDSMKISSEDYKGAMNMIVAGSKAGQFEMESMAKWLPELASAYGTMGQTGPKAVAELTAALQVARMGAGSADEAANNYKNFLSKLTSPDTIKAFNDAGIDLQTSMRNMAKEGLSPTKSMLNIVETYLGKSGPAAATKYKQALEIKDQTERETALQRLDEAYKLGELFRDQEAMSFLRSGLANRDKMNQVESSSTAAATQNVNGVDFALRMDTAGSSLRGFQIGMNELGLAISDGLLPSLNELLKTTIPVVRGFSGWVKENPALVSGLVKFAAGAVALRLGLLGVAYTANLGMSGLNGLGIAMSVVSGKFSLLRGAMVLGKFGPLIKGLRDIKPMMQSVGKGVLWMAKGSLALGKALGGKLVTGLRLVGQTALWLGRALLMNPIGLLITGIAVGAYLIYRYWEPIKSFFGGLWTEVKAGFSGGLSGILGLLVNFSPVGLFYRAFSAVMSYFGVELPDKFTEFGGMLITGLVNGISNMAGSLKDSVVGVGSSVKGWFTETLGIQSPSRVFMGYGENVSEGAAIGIAGQTGLIRKAALGMVAATAVNLSAPQVAQAAPSPLASQAQAFASATQSPALARGGPMAGVPGDGGVTVHLTQNFTINGSSGGTQQQILNAGRTSFDEFKRMLERVEHDRRRLSYGPT
ncbi:phage tail tape measure protein [Pseudomonas chlororaphis]|uniref:phage tail tape measure protein n=1 Tax=Pseudomonas chlororaphis TaxID=587753 RepID=UPI000D0E4328|nr:phage tail tape measure protein [Pseudomonas chlororaphis]AVO60967.1 phage tail tape measure protein [Pseudomonas chlororaphis subsp. piscium]